MLVVQKVDICNKFAFISILRKQRAPKITFHELRLEAVNARSCSVLLVYILQLFLLFLELGMRWLFSELEVRLYKYSVAFFLVYGICSMINL